MKIRLIELFAGVGSQAMAMRDIGADYETYRVVEIDKYAIASYNAIHNTDFVPIDITKITADDLGIVDTDRYEYVMTYSFPCTDLSICGLQRGMSKDSGTRSSLIWEVERLLNECGDTLPQYLIMENVCQVHSKNNMQQFQQWISFLQSKGYTSYYADLSAIDYGIPQTRKRCYMVSKLSDNFRYDFPKPISLDTTIRDYLETDIDDKYYVNNAKTEKLINTIIAENKLAKGGFLGNFYGKSCGFDGSVYSIDSCVGTITASNTKYILTDDMRIRKLTPCETWKLMGFSEEDFKKARVCNSDTQLYKQAGNSIVKQVLKAIFNQLLVS